MRERTLGGLRVRLAGGTDGHGGGDGLMVVLLHGFGAPGTDLVPLSLDLGVSGKTRFAFPEAPLALDAAGNGRAWWMVDLVELQAALAAGRERDLSDTVPEGLERSRGAVIAMLDELDTQLGIRSERVVLGGFSQGAMLACDVALRDARPLSGLMLMSGTMLAQCEWEPLMPSRAGLPVLQSHGRFDPLLPMSMATRLRDALSAAGLLVRWSPFDGGHEIPASVLSAADGYLSEL
jgi:phospholipase/carboxylesterase